MEVFKARVLGGNLYLHQKLHSIQSGVLPVYYSDHAAIYSNLFMFTEVIA
jgi:hypothetical protein